VLEHPEDFAPRLVLADWLEDESDPRAARVRKHCERGDVYFSSYTLSGDGTGDSPGVVHLVIQLVSQRIAVAFGCRCTDHVLPAYEREIPDERPRQLTLLVRRWLSGEATKKAIHQFLETLADVTDDRAAMPPAGELWTREEEGRRYSAVCVARSA